MNVELREFPRTRRARVTIAKPSRARQRALPPPWVAPGLLRDCWRVGPPLRWSADVAVTLGKYEFARSAACLSRSAVMIADVVHRAVDSDLRFVDKWAWCVDNTVSTCE
jgi:hypothetical protein